MNRGPLLIAFLFIFLWSESQIMWQIKTDTVITWHYYDGDEFNGKTVDTEKWIPAYSWSNVNYQFDYRMTPERQVYENGVCKFMCYQDTGLYTVPEWQLDSTFRDNYRKSLTNNNQFKYYYTAGNVWSKQQYTKGYFEIRFKSTSAYGIWPAFWLYGSNKDEIDFFELKGEKHNKIHIDVHCLEGCDSGYRGGSIFPKSFGGWIRASDDLTQTYNVLSGEWQNGYVKWYLNGVGIGYYKGEFDSQKMNLIIGTGPAKAGLGFSPGVNETTFFPNSLDVDYVRVWYREKLDKNAVLGNKNESFSFVKEEMVGQASPKSKIRYMYSKKVFQEDLLTVSLLPSNNGNYILTSLGKKIDYTISFFDSKGDSILTQAIHTSFIEIQLPANRINQFFTVKLIGPNFKIEQLIK